MKKWWLLLVGLGLSVRLAVAWLPISTLIAHTLPDDAFIYFVIARNIASGAGATFDGIRATNGFHPIWALAITPIFWALPTGDLPLHLALTLEAVCDVAAGAIAAWTVALTLNKSITQSTAPLLTLALYLFNPRAIQESTNGLETGVAMLAMAGCVAAGLRLATAPESRGQAVVFGALAGITVLARSDLGLMLPLLAVPLLIRKHWQAVILSAAAATVVVAPWLVWSQLRVGTVVQSSGVAIPSLAAYRIQTSTDPAELWNSLLFPVMNYSFRYTLIYPGVAILAALVGLVLLRLAVLRKQAADFRLEWRLLLPLLGALLVIFVHTFVRWYPRGWYFAPLTWSGAVAAGPLLTAALATPLGRRFGSWIVILLGLVVVAQSVKMIAEPEFKWQADMRAGAEWLGRNTGESETVGAFNAGIYAYYSERRVLSLDGLVDWDAIQARQQKKLLDYFQERGGELIVDHEAYIQSFSPFFGARRLERVTELPVVDDTYGPIVVYRVR